MSISEVSNWFDDFESSNIEEFGHHGGYLYVVFKSGDTYRYPNVESQVFEAFKLADSKGRYFGSVIRKCYTIYEKIEKAEKPEWLKKKK